MQLGKITIIIVGIMIASFLIGGIFIVVDQPVISGRNYLENIHQEQTHTTAFTSLNIDVVSASVEVIPTTSDQVLITLTGRGATDEQPQLLVNEQGDELRVTIKRPDRHWLSLINSDLKLTVALPNSTNLTATSTSGSVKVLGVTTEKCKLKSVSGSIMFDPSAEAGCSLETTSGSIRATSLSGTSTATSTSGSMDLSGINGNIQAATTSGSIKASYDQVTGKNTLTTISGSVRITTTSDAAYSFTGKSVSGSVRAAGLTLQETRDGYVQATKNAGTASIYAASTSGSIAIN